MEYVITKGGRHYEKGTRVNEGTGWGESRVNVEMDKVLCGGGEHVGAATGVEV